MSDFRTLGLVGIKQDSNQCAAAYRGARPDRGMKSYIRAHKVEKSLCKGLFCPRKLNHSHGMCYWLQVFHQKKAPAKIGANDRSRMRYAPTT